MLIKKFKSPIIVKRIHYYQVDHRVSQWKVAYADFVTAMMAFFLLLWLVSTTSMEQKTGIAQYFTPTMGLKDMKGIGTQGGQRAMVAGKSRMELSRMGLVPGQIRLGSADDMVHSETGEATKDSEEAARVKKPDFPDQTDEFQSAQEGINQALEKDPDLQDSKHNIVMQDTPEGLKIDMIDDPLHPMFDVGSAKISPSGEKILASIARIIARSPNTISIHGHVEVMTSAADPRYTSWELSTDRANAVRRFLVPDLIEPERISRVVGEADRDLMNPQNPSSPRNRRMTIVLVRNGFMKPSPNIMPTTRGLLTMPEVKADKGENGPQK